LSVGEALAEARYRAGLTVDEVSERTRIREAVIRCIELDDYDACGGDLYVRGYVRAIAGAVGIDAQPLIREYDAERADAAPDATGPARGIFAASPVGTALAATATVPEPPTVIDLPKITADPHNEDSAVAAQEATAADPEATAADPEVTAADPDVTVADPDVTVADPEFTVADPDVTVADPEFTVADLEVDAADTDVIVADPDIPVADPDVTAAALDATIADPEFTITDSDFALLEPQLIVPDPASGLPDPWDDTPDPVRAAPVEPAWAASAFEAASPPKVARPARVAKPAKVAKPAVAAQPRQPSRWRARVKSSRWVTGIAVLVVIALAVAGFAGSRIASHLSHQTASNDAAARQQAARQASQAGKHTGGKPATGAGHSGNSPKAPKAPKASKASKAHASTTRAPHALSAHWLPIALAAAFGPDGTADGDNPQGAQFAITPSSLPWRTDWYASADFGQLKSGTGLLLDMGKSVTVTSVRLELSPDRGANLQLKMGSSTTLTDLRAAAGADDVGGTIQLQLRSPVHARYVLIWFTLLPPNGAGQYQESVYRVVVNGRA
jgi:Helix-turn-helix domain